MLPAEIAQLQLQGEVRTAAVFAQLDDKLETVRHSLQAVTDRLHDLDHGLQRGAQTRIAHAAVSAMVPTARESVPSQADHLAALLDRSLPGLLLRFAFRGWRYAPGRRECIPSQTYTEPETHGAACPVLAAIHDRNQALVHRSIGEH